MYVKGLQSLLYSVLLYYIPERENDGQGPHASIVVEPGWEAQFPDSLMLPHTAPSGHPRGEMSGLSASG
jgi:hypothetical protein